MSRGICANISPGRTCRTVAEAGGSLLWDALAPPVVAVPASTPVLALDPGPVGDSPPASGPRPGFAESMPDAPAAAVPALSPILRPATRGAWTALALGLALSLMAWVGQQGAPAAPLPAAVLPPLPALAPWPPAIAGEPLVTPPLRAPVAPAPAATVTPPAPADGPAPAPRLRITSAAAPAPSALELAHAAYQRGDLAAAERANRVALAQTPHHPDALLGLAAIAERRGEIAAARAAYATVLALDPGQWAARASLWTLPPLTPEASPQSAPDAPAPSARNPEEDARRLDALGRAAADAGRWGQAHALFAAAAAAVPTAPDYAFALAVSLDRLRLPAAASAAYREALELGQQTPAGFAPAAVRARLAALNAAAGGGAW